MHNFLFGIYPYIAITIMVAVSAVRYDRDPFTWKSRSSQLLRKRHFVVGSVLFHVGILTIFFGHFVGLLTPIQLFEFFDISHEFKQILAIVVGGIAGLMTLVGGTILLHRRLTDPRIRANSNLADTGIMVLLMLQLLLGLGTIYISLQHLDGGEMVRFMGWAQAILYLRGDAADYIIGASPLFKAHILTGLTIFLLFPFTRLVHIFSAPVRYLWRPGYQIVRSRRGAKPARSGLSPMARRGTEQAQ